MTVLMNAPTADPFGIVSTFPAKFQRVATSTMNIDVVSERIRRVLASWEHFDVVPVELSVNLGDEAPPAVRPYPTTPVEGVEYLSEILQISQDAVLRGTGIAERTFFGWRRRPNSRPRPASIGKLWPMIETLTVLGAVHPNLAAWFHSTPDAQEAFATGNINRLLQLELEWVNGHTEVAPTQAPWFGDPADLLAELVAEADEDADVARHVQRLRARSTRVGRTPLPSSSRERTR